MRNVEQAKCKKKKNSFFTKYRGKKWIILFLTLQWKAKCKRGNML